MFRVTFLANNQNQDEREQNWVSCGKRIIFNLL